MIKIDLIDFNESGNPNSAVVMYHYVRDLIKSDFPKLHARNLSEFEYQLQDFVSNYKVVSSISSLSSRKKSLILTFDDGLKDHFTNVFPRLIRAGLPGSFYVSSGPLRKTVVLAVHKIQLLVATQKIDILVTELEKLLGSVRLSSLRDELSSKGDLERFDESEVLFFKRALQRDLEKDIRTEVLNSLFSRFFPDQEKSISQSLYMSLSEIHELKSAGMHIGNHTENHEWLGFLDLEEALEEVIKCENFLLEEGLIDKAEMSIAYPYGSYSQDLVLALIKRSYRYGYTTVPSDLQSTTFEPLTIPRLDTNDFVYRPN